MSRLGNLGGKLYRGEVSYDFVGRRRRWYAISAVILVLALGGLLGRGLNLGIEFKGGAVFTVPHTTGTIEEARTVVETAGVSDPIVTQVGDDGIRVQTPALTPVQSTAIAGGLAVTLGVPNEDIAIQNVGPSWGAQVTQQALKGLGLFLLAVVIFLTAYFEWRMAVAALVALAHNTVITVGIYALTGIEVTPATVIGVLTILGFSLYDVVVVFDKVRENTRGIASQSRVTYSQSANLALNQTLVRSINTSIVALLPVLAILVIGVGLLGAGTLKDLALALFVGTAAGTYSSIFIATPILCQLKEQDPAMKALAARVARGGGRTAVTVGAGQDPEAPTGSAAGGTASGRVSTAVPTGPRTQPKKQTRSKRK